MNAISDMRAPAASMDLAIEGMTCASCSGRVERALRKVPGVEAAEVNLASEIARVTAADVDPAALIAAVERAGYAARRIDPAAKPDPAADRDAMRHEYRHLAIAAVLTAPLVLSMVIGLAGARYTLPGWLAFVLATPVQFWIGARFYRAGFRAVRAGSANMDVLVALGTSAAYGMSVYLLVRAWLIGGTPALYFDSSSVVITLILFGKILEQRGKRQTGAALQALTALRPDQATLRTDDGTERIVPIGALRVGSRIRVKPGERIAVDGIIIEGESAIDLSMLTGESVPVTKGVGETVTGGAINGDGVLLVETTAVGAETALARIIRLVETAQAGKAPIQALVDRVAAVFVPAVLVVALVTLVGWLLAGGTVEHAVLSAVAVLVIACPCSLGLATPAAVMAGTGVAATNGILVRDAEALDRARSIDTVAFDKTGTLTEGRPDLIALHAAGGVDAPTVLRLAAAVQRGSDHPLARAVLARATRDDVQVPEAQAMKTLPGRGVEGNVEGRRVVLGSARMLAETGAAAGALTDIASGLAHEGRTVSWLIERGHAAPVVLGLLAFGDALKPGARNAVAALRARGLRVLLLTGDNPGSAGVAARALGIDEVLAEILPDQKAAKIEALRREGRKIAMVGDGVNDAPALAAADLGIAMATGSDIAMHTAGITLMRGDPALVAAAFDIANRTFGKIRQGLFWAFAFNTVGIPLAAFGYLNPMIAGAAMAASSVIVVSNALLLRRWRQAD